jgi:hypothetical protein
MIHIRPMHHEILCLTLITENRTRWLNESQYYPKMKQNPPTGGFNIFWKVKTRVCVCACVRAGYRHYKAQLSMQAYKQCCTNLIVVLHLRQYSCGRRKLHVPRRAHVLGP